MAEYRVAVDVGGTFTDFVIQDAQSGLAFTNKVLSTTEDQANGVLAGLEESISDFGELSGLVHGNTVALNAFLERRGDRVLFVTTEGFRDLLRLGRGNRTKLFDVRYRKHQPLVPVTDVVTVSERINVDGTVRTPLAMDDVDSIVKRIRQDDIKTVAVCLLHAYRNPAHEIEVRDFLLAEIPGLSVSLSHELAAEWREYERSSTTALNAYVAPKIETYLGSLIQRLGDGGFSSTLHVMQSNGGTTTAPIARRHPVFSFLSGPVGGTMGGVKLAELLERPNLMCVDMGGTSFDASMVIDGAPSVSTEAELEGLPLLLPIVDIHTIGAGGGSVAWLEAGGLRVGPESAGSMPGPACYGRGGTRATVTDANAVLGRIDPAYFLDGGMALDIGAAEAAIASIASPLGLSTTEAAEGILAIVNAKMADAMRTLTVERGLDPRGFSLVAFGGAGPMHAIALAEELEISEVIVPWAPGAFSAWGMLHTDVRRDLAKSHYRPSGGLDGQELAEAFDDLVEQGDRLLEVDGVPQQLRRYVRAIDLRYTGQEYTLTVEVPNQDPADVSSLFQQFHDDYFVRYGHSTPEAPVDAVAIRLAASGVNPRPVATSGEPSTNGSTEARPEARQRGVVFGGTKHQATISLRNEVDAPLPGPAIVEEPTATTVVPPGWTVTVGPANSLVIVNQNV